MEPKHNAQPILRIKKQQKMEVEEEQPPSNKVSWDEPTLAEHLKLKGTYMKIDEPKTPYRKHNNEQHPIESFSLATATEEERQVEQHLAQAQLNKAKNQKRKLDLAAINAALMKEYKESGNISEEEQEDEQSRRKRTNTLMPGEQFNKKRAMHYGGEFKKINNWQNDDD